MTRLARTMRSRFAGRLSAATLILAVATGLGGCAQMRIPFLTPASKVAGTVDLIAILPVDSATAPAGEDNQLDTGAELAVTAAVYGALSSSYEWRFVPDLTVADAMQTISPLDAATKRAVELGKATKADAVIFGSVWRFVERKGTADAADRGASVAFTLRLVLVSTGEVVWEETFEQTQEELRSPVLDWVLFWEDAPQWLTAAELTQVGVDAMIQNLRRTLD